MKSQMNLSFENSKLYKEKSLSFQNRRIISRRECLQESEENLEIFDKISPKIVQESIAKYFKGGFGGIPK